MLTKGIEALKRGLRWAFWSPLRLLLVVAIILTGLVLAGRVSDRLGTGAEPTPSVPAGLPSGWETWGKVPGSPASRVAPSSTASPEVSSTASPEVSSTANPEISSISPTPASDHPAHTVDAEAAASAAQKVAVAFAREYLSPGAGSDAAKRQADWVRRVSVHVSPQLARDLGTVDLGNVPAAKVNTSSALTVSSFQVTVSVKTSAGDMTCVVDWSGKAWQVTDYVPPKRG